MAAELETKTDRYETMLSDALDAVEIEPDPGTERYESAEECREMAASYLADGRHFRAEKDPVNALAAFSYGHGWLDAGVRFGVLSPQTDEHLFTSE